MSLPGYLAIRAQAAGPRAGRDVSCILLWLQGGISHIDSFDPKPEAPEEIRGEFGAIATNVPGIQVCDPLPQLAQHQDKYSILRSLNPRNGSHGVADAYMMTGHPFNQSVMYPCLRRRWSRRSRATARRCRRTCSSARTIDQRFGGGVAGFLGDQYNPFVLPGDASRPELHGARRRCCPAASTATGSSGG